MRETKRGDWKRGSERDHLKPTRHGTTRHDSLCLSETDRGIDRETTLLHLPQMLTIVDPQTRALSTPPITQPPAPWWVMSSSAAANGTLRPPPGALCPALTGTPGQGSFWGPAGPGCWVAPSTERAVARRFYRRETSIWLGWGGHGAGVQASQGGVPAEWKRRFGRISEALGGWRRISLRSRVIHPWGICKRQREQGRWMEIYLAVGTCALFCLA